MAKFAHIQNSFKSGLLSEKLKGRTDIQEYRNGCLQLENFISYASGGASKRSGSQFLEDIQDRLATGTEFGIIPFSVSRSEAYTIILSPDISASSDNIAIYGSDGNFVTSLEAVQIQNGSLDRNGFMYAQSGDVIYICHNSGLVAPFVIKRTSVSTFSTQSYFSESQDNLQDGILSIPYQPFNLDDDKILVWTTGTPDVLTIEDSGGSPVDYFTSDHVGSFFKFNHGGDTTIVEILAFTDSSTVEARERFGPTIADATSVDDWAESSWNDERGYPRTVTIYQQRLIWGGTPFERDTLFNSVEGNFYIMMQNKLLQDSSSDSSGLNYFGSLEGPDAFSFSLSTNELNDITWLSSIRNLHVGTNGGEYIVANNSSGAYNPVDLPRVSPQTFHGSSAIKANRYGNLTLFVSKDGKKIRDFSYSESNGSNISRNLSILSDNAVYHNFSTGDYSDAEYKEIFYQQDKSVLWCLTSLGQLVGLTLSKSGDTVAWHTHTFGGTDVEIQSICVIPNEDGTGEDLYFVVKRTINSATEYYLERIGASFEHPLLSNTSTNSDDRPFYSDSAVRLTNGSPTTSYSGLDHLEGEEVVILADGVIQASKTVSSGAITLDTAAEEVITGLKYTSNLETMSLEAGAIIGNSQVLLKRIDDILMKLYKSREGQYYFTEGTEYAIEYEVEDNKTFTGVSKVDFDSTNDYDYTVKIRHDKPVPFNLLAMVFRGYTKD